MYGYQSYTTNFPITYDIDLRESIHNTLYGSQDEMPRGRYVVWQKLIRDSKGEPIKSPYTYKLTQEGQEDRGPATTRAGFLCEEKLIRCYVRAAGKLVFDEMTTPLGQIPLDRMIFECSAYDEIDEHDVLILPKINVDGSLKMPVAIDIEYNIVSIKTRCLDDGSVQYRAAIAEVQK